MSEPKVFLKYGIGMSLAYSLAGAAVIYVLAMAIGLVKFALPMAVGSGIGYFIAGLGIAIFYALEDRKNEREHQERMREIMNR